MGEGICGKSILVVDDDERMLRALDRVLSGEGAKVLCSSWAGTAIGILNERKEHVDLVIIDLYMPFISGMTAVRAIHKNFPNLPIIVLTAFGSADVQAECVRQGASVFLEKPLDSQALCDAIENVFLSRNDGAREKVAAGDGNDFEFPNASKMRRVP